MEKCSRCRKRPPDGGKKTCDQCRREARLAGKKKYWGITYDVTEEELNSMLTPKVYRIHPILLRWLQERSKME